MGSTRGVLQTLIQSANSSTLIKWFVDSLVRMGDSEELKGVPQWVFITHGEPEVSLSFAKFLRQSTNGEVSVPKYQDEVKLD